MARLPFPQRVVLVLLLAVVLTAPAIAAQPQQRLEDRQPGFVSALISELRVQVWSLLSGFWEKNGCGIDPHGACKAADTRDVAAATDEGCGIDPHGGCGH